METIEFLHFLQSDIVVNPVASINDHLWMNMTFKMFIKARFGTRLSVTNIIILLKKFNAAPKYNLSFQEFNTLREAGWRTSQCTK